MADDLYQHRHDSGEWAADEADITVQPSGEVVLSIRLPREQFRAVRAAARAAGVSLTDYTRAALAAWQPNPPIYVTLNHHGVSVEEVAAGIAEALQRELERGQRLD